MRFSLLLLILCSCQLTTPTTAPLDIPAEPFVGITARIREGVSSQPSSLDLEITLPIGWLDEPIAAVGLTFRDEEFRAVKGGYTTFIMEHKPGGFTEWPKIFEAKDNVLRVQYRMLLKHHEADPVVGVDEVPHPVANGWFLNGRAFIPFISFHYKFGDPRYVELPIRFTLTGEKSDKLLSSVDPVLYQGSHEYRSETTSGLRDALYVIGQPSLTSFTTSGVDVTIASSDFAGGDFTPLQKLIARTLAGGQSIVGAPSKKRFLLIYDSAPKRAGGVVGDGVSLLYSTLPGELARSEVGIVIVHELVHLWNQADEDWLNEGLTRYAETLWTAKLDALSPLEAWRLFLLLMDGYQTTPIEKSLREAQGKLAYQGGASMFLCLDANLRSEGLSLWKIWREARDKNPEDKRLQAATFLAVLQNASPSSATLADTWLDAKEHQDTTSCFQKLGLRYDASTKTLSADKEPAAILP